MYTACLVVNSDCNFECKYCYRHPDKGEISKELAFDILKNLREQGFEKVSFAGGEPTLLSWGIFEAIKYSKELGFVTELITNGTVINEKDIYDNANYLDVLAMDMDTIDPELAHYIGRTRNHKNNVERLFNAASTAGIKTKLNTVASALNLNKIIEICDWVKYSPVYRWKIFQFLPSIGYAKLNENMLKVERNEFLEMKKIIESKMSDWNGNLRIETNDFTSCSYASVDPQGNFYAAVGGNGSYNVEIIGNGLTMTMNDFMNCDKIDKKGFLKRCSYNEVFTSNQV